jgi:hypothetical protein
MKNLISVILIFVGLVSTGQSNFVIPDSVHQVFINLKGGVASSTLPQAFINKFIFPDFIQNELKDAASKKMKNINYFGGAVSGNVNILFSEKAKSSARKSFYGIGFGTNTEANLRFSDDLFNLTFYGNQPFTNQTLNLDKSNFNSLSYSYFEVSYGQSFVNKRAKSSVWSDLAFLVGHNFSTINLQKASVFTEQNGAYLDVLLSESSIILSDTSTSNLAKGFGAKLDLFYSRETENSKFLFSTENIGTIFWRNSESAYLDTTFRFEGLKIGNIFQLSDSIWNQVPSTDRLISNKNPYKTIPVDFSAYFQKDLNRLSFDVLARYRLFANYLPFLRSGINFNFQNIRPGITISYGGYNAFNLGFNTDISLFDSLKIQFGTNNVLSSIFPNTSSSLDAYLGLQIKIK